MAETARDETGESLDPRASEDLFVELVGSSRESMQEGDLRTGGALVAHLLYECVTAHLQEYHQRVMGLRAYNRALVAQAISALQEFEEDDGDMVSPDSERLAFGRFHPQHEPRTQAARNLVWLERVLHGESVDSIVREFVGPMDMAKAGDDKYAKRYERETNGQRVRVEAGLANAKALLVEEILGSRVRFAKTFAAVDIYAYIDPSDIMPRVGEAERRQLCALFVQYGKTTFTSEDVSMSAGSALRAGRRLILDYILRHYTPKEGETTHVTTATPIVDIMIALPPAILQFALTRGYQTVGDLCQLYPPTREIPNANGLGEDGLAVIRQILPNII